MKYTILFGGFREGLGQTTSSHEPHVRVCVCRTKDFRRMINTYLESQKWSFKFWPSAFSVSSAVPELATFQLPNTQLLDGWNSRHLPINQEKMSRRVWEEAIEGPTGQVVNFDSSSLLVIHVIRIYPYMTSFRHILSWSHCLQGLSLITKINLKNCVELRCGRSEGSDCVGRLITLLQEASVFLGTLERRLESMQWRFRRRKKSTRLPSSSWASHNLLQILWSSCPVKRGQGVVAGLAGQCDRYKCQTHVC